MKKYILPTIIATSLFSLVGCGVETPTNVSDIKAVGHDNAISLSWKEINNANSYLVYQDETEIKEVYVNYVTIQGLNNNSQYRFGIAPKYEHSIGEVKYVTAKPVEGENYDPFIDEINTSLEEQIGATNIKKMFRNANINSNITNLYRYKRVIDAMKNGTSQTIGYIGGSITVGEKSQAVDLKGHQKGYAYYSYQWLKNNYDKNNNSKFINASISGTDTMIASVRLEKDLLQYNPDLVFIEFAANNSTSQFDKVTYESIVRRVLNQPNAPAVVLLFSAVSYSGHTQEYMSAMGNYYKLPMVSFVNAMNGVCGNLNENRTDPIFRNFTEDGVHPNDIGHKLYAKVIVKTLKTIYESNVQHTDYQVPVAPSQSGYNAYENITYVNHEVNNSVITSLGSFVSADTSTRVTRDTADIEAFRKGWKKTTTTANDPMTIEVSCKSFFLIYEAGNSYIAGDPKGKMIISYQNKDNASDKGELSWESDRTCKQTTYSVINDNGNGWQNPCCIIGLDKLSVGNYIIKIQMEKNSDIGTIMAFGYCI